jgi:hypothetical protein
MDTGSSAKRAPGENVMSEFGQIFESDLTAAVYVYGSLAAFAVCAIVTLWVTRSRAHGPLLVQIRFRRPAPAVA